MARDDQFHNETPHGLPADASEHKTAQFNHDGMLSPSRRAMLAGLGATAFVAGCGPQGFGNLGLPGGTATQPQGQVAGSGNARVALLLPLTATGNAGNVGQNLKNAADMAVAELGGNDITLITKDTGGTPEGARNAAGQALSEGAQMVVGPVFAPEVASVGSLTRPAGVPVIAFSTDQNVAGRGVYLLSFLPSSDVRRIIGFASLQQRRNFVAVLPDNSYGQLMEAAFRTEVSRIGGQVVKVEKYALDQVAIATAASNVRALSNRMDALFMPDAGDAVGILARELKAGGVTPQSHAMLGSGQWNGAAVHNNGDLAGAFYPSPDKNSFGNFSSKYRSRYGSSPIRIASLSYDAVTLAAALARAGGGRINPNILTSASGFSGADGIFRFLPNGANQRGLAVYRVTGSGTAIADPAPATFSA